MYKYPLSRYAAIASSAAIKAGSFLVRYVGKPRRVETKRSAIDLVSEIDRASERLIHRILHNHFPDHGFCGEEYANLRREAPLRWIVDPLDGTNNFIHGLPLFGVSIALEHMGTPIVGVIYDPIRKELFTATIGGGSFLNGKRIHVSRIRQLSRSLLSTGFSSKFSKNTRPYLDWFTSFQRSSHGVRRIGSTVLCLAAIAAGRMEGFYEQDLWPWDIAAGIVLVQEAGGNVSDFDGSPVSLTEGRLVASNGRIHREMISALNPK